MKREIRIFKGSELRAKKGTNGIEGHAAVFNELSQDLGGFRERVMPGAFADDLAAKPDVRALFNHDPNIIFGRTTSGTLRLEEDHAGLKFDCDMPDTTQARDVQTSIARGDISQCSFGFFVVSQKWSEEPDPADPTGQRKMLSRELHKVKTFDVSPVTFPAYTGTDVDTRTLFPEGVPGEIRSHVKGYDRRGHAKRAKGAPAEGKRDDDSVCACTCDECIDGNCPDCVEGVDCKEENCMHAGESADRAIRSAKRQAQREEDKPAGQLVTGEEFEVLMLGAQLALRMAED
jgi:HK97 family phage prohead protease